MFKRFFDWLGRGVEWTAGASTWSTLAAIGESRVIRLTILIPFVGYLILYNEYVVGFFGTAYVLHMDGDPAIAVMSEGLYRLNLLYFGLTALGLASFAYTLFVPRDIARNPSDASYVQFSMLASTPAILVRTIYQSVGSYAWFAERDDAGTLRQRLTYSPEWCEAMDDFVRDANKQIGEPEMFGVVVNSTGYVDYSGFISAIHPQIAANKAQVANFGSVVPLLEKDVWQINYLRLNHSSPYVRLIVITLYIAGFALLFFPTITVTIRIFSRWFGY